MVRGALQPVLVLWKVAGAGAGNSSGVGPFTGHQPVNQQWSRKIWQKLNSVQAVVALNGRSTQGRV